MTAQMLPRDEEGFIQNSADFGVSWMVRVEYNTDYDGRRIDPDELPPTTFHGPFTDQEEAVEWIRNYPEDMDVESIELIIVNNVRPQGEDMKREKIVRAVMVAEYTAVGLHLVYLVGYKLGSKLRRK